MTAFFGPLGWSAERCAALNAAHLRYLARWTVEVGRLFHQPAAEVAERVEVAGEEHLQNALRQGRGVLLLISHLGTNLHVGCVLGLRGYPLCGVFNARSSAGRDYFRRLAARHRFEFAFLRKDAALAFRRALRKNIIFGLAIDVGSREERSVPVRFGHMMIPVNLGPAILALQHRCAVVLATSRQTENGRSRVTFIPDESAAPPSPVALYERWLKVFYDELLACPEQWWLWSFANMRHAGQAPAENPWPL
jgi:KDO2-lipid IV(A) lauroyltransferase